MTYAAQARARYTTNAVSTASPARLLVMLYDRLVLDLTNAEQAARSSQAARASAELQHAQDIVLELRTSLDLDAWDGAQGLADLYTWLYAELIAANVRQDPQRIAACLAVVAPLRDGWRTAALSLLQPA